MTARGLPRQRLPPETREQRQERVDGDTLRALHAYVAQELVREAIRTVHFIFRQLYDARPRPPPLIAGRHRTCREGRETRIEVSG